MLFFKGVSILKGQCHERSGGGGYLMSKGRGCSLSRLGV